MCTFGGGGVITIFWCDRGGGGGSSVFMVMYGGGGDQIIFLTILRFVSKQTVTTTFMYRCGTLKWWTHICKYVASMHEIELLSYGREWHFSYCVWRSAWSRLITYYVYRSSLWTVMSERGKGTCHLVSSHSYSRLGRWRCWKWFHKGRNYVEYYWKCIKIVVCSGRGNSLMLWVSGDNRLR